MQSTENKTDREKMVNMHDYFINHIKEAMKNKNYIEANWLIYACLENRYFRLLSKFKQYCNHCKGSVKCAQNENVLALRTKIKCVQRLYEEKVPCIYETFDQKLFDKTLDWVSERNSLMHNLLSLDSYQQVYETKFEKLAKTGRTLLTKTYKSCTKFRKHFYNEQYVFIFPENCMGKCSNKSNNSGGKVK